MQVAYREIIDFPGYRVGDDGSVWSQWGKGNSTSTKCSLKWKRLKGRIRKDGYITVTLYNNGTSQEIRVHRLVLEAFEGPCPNGQEVRHRNRVRSDNELANLCYGTRKQNMEDAILHGTTCRGQKNGHAKLSDSLATKIKRSVLTGEKRQCEWAREAGVSPTTIGELVKGKDHWKHLPTFSSN